MTVTGTLDLLTFGPQLSEVLWVELMDRLECFEVSNDFELNGRPASRDEVIDFAKGGRDIRVTLSGALVDQTEGTDQGTADKAEFFG
jgi:hypothetical protein